MEAVCDTLPTNAVLVDETISSGGGLRTLFRSDDPKSYFGMRGGGIGWGLPGVLGVKLALANRPVVALVGDGSALCAIQGLWTAAHYGLGVVLVICNNSGYRILKQRTHALQSFSAKGNRYIGMDLEDPAVDFVGLARSLGVPGKRVEKTQELRQTLAGALTQGGPFLIDVPLDRGFQS
jgi:benzoylformate decarboxylase